MKRSFIVLVSAALILVACSGDDASDDALSVTDAYFEA